LVRAMVYSVKHYVSVTVTPVSSASTVVFTVADAVDRTLANIANEVSQGSSIKAVWMEMWIKADITAQFFTAVFGKLPAGVGNYTQAELVDLYTSDKKKNILYTTQGLTSEDSVSGPINIYKGWIKIPKGKQRMGLGDRLQFALSSRATGIVTFCGMFIYKEYT